MRHFVPYIDVRVFDHFHVIPRIAGTAIAIDGAQAISHAYTELQQYVHLASGPRMLALRLHVDRDPRTNTPHVVGIWRD